MLLTSVFSPSSLGVVTCLASAPFLLDHPDVTRMFPRDAIARARFYLQKVPGGIGAYRYAQLSS